VSALQRRNFLRAATLRDFREFATAIKNFDTTSICLDQNRKFGVGLGFTGPSDKLTGTFEAVANS